MAFWKYRTEVESCIEGQTVDRRKILRLICHASIEAFIGLPINLYILIQNAIFARGSSYVNWEHVHEFYSDIPQTSYVVWSADRYSLFAITLNEWAYVFFALMFFTFFGCSKELRDSIVILPKCVRRARGNMMLSSMKFGSLKPSNTKLR